MQSAISDRKQLREELETSLLYANELENESKPERKFKTFIIESNVASPTLLENVAVQKTNDQTLNSIFINNNYFWIDSNDQRFWVIYTFEKVKEAMASLDKLITLSNSKLDHIWLGSGTLEKISTRGEQAGFGTLFDNNFLTPEKEEFSETMKMRFSGTGSKKVLDYLRASDEIRDTLALSKIGLKYKATKEDIYFDGRFVIKKGQDIDNHFELVKQVKDVYERIIENIEKNYRISIKQEHNFLKVNGNSIIIEFPKRREDISFIIDRLFSGTTPFRLLGVKTKLDEDYYKVSAVDLHSYDKITVEVCPDFLRIYLDGNACGNVITRLSTNLEKYFQPNIKILGAEDEQII